MSEASDVLSVVREVFAIVEGRHDSTDQAKMQRYVALHHPDVVVHEAPSLPYGGDYHGHDGLIRHAAAFAQWWDPLQTDDSRNMEARFAVRGDEVTAIWRLRARRPDTGEVLDAPVMSAYRLHDSRLVETRMHHFDSAAVAAFLARGRSPS